MVKAVSREGTDPTSMWPSWKTIGGVALIASVAVAAFCLYQYTGTSLPHEIVPCQGDALEKGASKALAVFSDKVVHSVHAGLLATIVGGCFCGLDTRDISIEECTDLCEKNEGIIRTHYPQLIPEIFPSDGNYFEKGYMMVGPDGVSTSHNLDPLKLSNAKIVYNHLGEEVLKDPVSFFSKDGAEIFEKVKESNRYVLRSLQLETSMVVPGELRTEGMMIFSGENDPRNQAEVIERLQEAGISQREEMYVVDGFKRMEQVGDVNTVIRQDPKLQKIFEKIAYFPTWAEDLPEAVERFASELKTNALEIMTGERDPFDAAAYIHNEMGRIHPFGDGNGRTGRFWMNLLLQLGGKEAVIFPSNSIYMEKVAAGDKAFANYLRTLS